MPKWIEVERDGVRLACRDFGGAGPTVLLLHGLAGHAGEWSPLAEKLTGKARVVSLEARGHGRSERRPDDLSPDAQVEDVAFVIERLGAGSVVLVGQSLGGRTALIAAAERPDLVRGLVLVEAGPAADDKTAMAQVVADLASWPVPFRSREAAVEYFGGPSGGATAWAGGLERYEDGLRPGWELDVMAAMLRANASTSLWAEWEAIRAPALIVRAARGSLSAREVTAMCADGRAESIEIPGSGHDAHLDQPELLARALAGFLEGT